MVSRTPLFRLALLVILAGRVERLSTAAPAVNPHWLIRRAYRTPWKRGCAASTNAPAAATGGERH
jgi:hypothetical protein